MRLDIHHKIGKNICYELKELGCQVNEKMFLLGNLFPDLVHSYIWRRHEYQHSREFVWKKLDILKKRPKLFSFHLGILTHYICDYFCYPHSNCYEKGMIQHILYELRQKAPHKYYKTKLNIRAFAIEELDSLVRGYENIRSHFDDESDYHFATMVASNFLQAVY